MGTINISTNSEEENLIKRLKAISPSLASSADRTVALYIAGMSSRKVHNHIKQKTFSGARAIHHISDPDTPEARSAWSRGKNACRTAGLEIRRLNWTDRPTEDLFDIKQNESRTDKMIVRNRSNTNIFSTKKTIIDTPEPKSHKTIYNVTDIKKNSDHLDDNHVIIEQPFNTDMQKNIRQKKFWEKIFNITKEKNIKIINAKLAGPADILEAQLQPILWYCLRQEGMVSVVESSFDPQNIRKKLDMIFESQDEHYIVEIKRNGLGLEGHGKTYTDSIDVFPKDFEKLNNAQTMLKNRYKSINKIFIEIQYFKKDSSKYESHRKKLKILIKNQSMDWANGIFFEFGGPNDIIFSSHKGDICIAMRILIAN